MRKAATVFELLRQVEDWALKQAELLLKSGGESTWGSSGTASRRALDPQQCLGRGVEEWGQTSCIIFPPQVWKECLLACIREEVIC